MSDQATIEKRPTEVTRAERTQSGRVYVPNVDIIEKADELLVMADVPGARAEEIDIHFERGVLTIDAHVKPRRDESKTRYLLREYGVGDFSRRFEVDDKIDASRIVADVKNGVLTLHLPKADEIKPRKITVKGD